MSPERERTEQVSHLSVNFPDSRHQQVSDGECASGCSSFGDSAGKYERASPVGGSDCDNSLRRRQSKMPDHEPKFHLELLEESEDCMGILYILSVCDVRNFCTSKRNIVSGKIKYVVVLHWYCGAGLVVALE